jgi:hypothetical protein
MLNLWLQRRQRPNLNAFPSSSNSCDELPPSYLERYAAALFLNGNLAVFAKYDPTSVARSKSRRAPRTAVGLIG